MRPTRMSLIDDRVMDLRDEPAPCQVCGEDASEYPCELGTWCEAHHADLGTSGCRLDACWGADFGDRDD